MKQWQAIAANCKPNTHRLQLQLEIAQMHCQHFVQFAKVRNCVKRRMLQLNCIALPAKNVANSITAYQIHKVMKIKVNR